MVDVCLLGTGGMLPLLNRFLTSMVLRYKGKMILVDCGEGTQVALRNTVFGYKKIDYICFTHFHADHITGLPGLLLTIGNSDRTDPITIVGPRGIGDIVKNITVVARDLPFKINFIEVPEKEDFSIDIFNKEVVLNAKNLRHGSNIQCLGYSFNIKRPGKFDVEKATKNNVPKSIWGVLQKQEETVYEGVLYKNNQVLGEPRKGIKVSYCTDTRPFDDLANFVSESDLFICEGLYGDDDKLSNAKKHNHMIFREACELAQKGNVKKLWLTHYSPALIHPEQYEDFAKSIFAGAEIGVDGKTVEIEFYS